MLVVTMVALPIGALTTAAIAIHTSVPTDRERVIEDMGTADLRVEAYRGVSDDEIRAELPAGSQAIPIGYLSLRPLIERAEIVYFFLTEYGLPIDEPPVEGIYLVHEGRAPAGPGEVAVHPSVLEVLDVGIGGMIEPQRDVSLRITGTVLRAGNVNDQSGGVVGPGTLASLGRKPSRTWLVDLPPDVEPSVIRTRFEALGDVYVSDAETIRQTHAGDEEAATGGAFAAAALLLLGTGLVAGAAFAVGARRQLRVLGLVGATGAERRHIRATVLLGGVSLGMVGSIVGAGIGITASHVLRPWFVRLAGRDVGPIDVPWASVAGAAVLGVLAAALAAVGPARSAARLSVLEAIAGRTPPPRRPGRIAAAGALAVVGGATVTTVGTTSDSGIVLTIGLITMIVGFLVAIPLLVTWSGTIAAFLPTLARIAMRDVARNGRRTGAALAAGAIALAAPVAIATLTLADEAREERIPYMASDHLNLYAVGSRMPSVQAVHRAGIALVRAFPGAIAVEVVPAVTLVERNGRDRERMITIPGPVETVPGGGQSQTLGSLLIGGADLLRAFHADDGIDALERGDVVGLGPETVLDGTVDLEVDGSRDGPLYTDLPAESAGATRYSSIGISGFDFVISPDRAAELGLRPSSKTWVRTHVVVRTPRPLDEIAIEEARDVVAGEPLVYVTTLEDLGSDAGFVRTIAALAGIGLALAVVAVIVALLSAESRRDRAILVAVGAGPSARRAVAGASAAAVGSLSSVLALLVGFFPTVVFLLAQPDQYDIVIPWVVLGAVLLGVPAVAGAIGALISRQPKAAQLLRPIA